ncbi:hypothetical protein TWF696_009646 [Orbilia brochopaga]|uniref:Uncharacterized protein n=1 Tax=Orbilia brochopaga TaxID=3140254 RepID=A0AAV9UFE4_9PEZI
MLDDVPDDMIRLAIERMLKLGRRMPISHNWWSSTISTIVMKLIKGKYLYPVNIVISEHPVVNTSKASGFWNSSAAPDQAATTVPPSDIIDNTHQSTSTRASVLTSRENGTGLEDTLSPGSADISESGESCTPPSTEDSTTEKPAAALLDELNWREYLLSQQLQELDRLRYHESSLKCRLEDKDKRCQELESLLGDKDLRCQELKTLITDEDLRFRELETLLDNKDLQKRELEERNKKLDKSNRELEKANGELMDEAIEMSAEISKLKGDLRLVSEKLQWYTYVPRNVSG